MEIFVVLFKINIINILFFYGIVVRILCFLCLPSFNNDGQGHLANIHYIYHFKSLPRSDFSHQAYHPPLYHLIAALFAAGEPYFGVKSIQFISLLLSISTLFASYVFIVKTRLFSTEFGRVFCFGLVALLPQFVFNTIIISNDTLAIFIGFACANQIYYFSLKPSYLRLANICLLVSIGLLTKGSYLIFLVVLPFWVFVVFLLYGVNVKQAVGCTLIFAFCTCLLGSYKYFQNAIDYGMPFLSNLDFNYDWVQDQRASYREWQGVPRFFIIEFFNLLKGPIMTSDQFTYSAPVLLYGTFWFQYIPDGPFYISGRKTVRYFGTIMYLSGLISTFFVILGLFRIVFLIFSQQKKIIKFPFFISRIVFVILFVGNIFLLIFVVWKTEVWSVFQARLLFPTFTGALILFDYGSGLVLKYSLGSLIFRVNAAILFFLFSFFYIAIFSFSIFKWFYL
jgi:hypothetical protein